MKPFKVLKEYRYFESQEKGENVLLITRKHWLTLVVPFIFCAFAGLILIYFFWIAFSRGNLLTGELHPAAQACLSAIIILYAVLAAFGSWLTRYLNVIILTNKHIVDVSQNAFFARSVSTLALDNIEDVAIDKNGFLATILDYGSIKIQTAGELPNFELKNIADPETVQRTMMEAKASFKK